MHPSGSFAHRASDLLLSTFVLVPGPEIANKNQDLGEGAVNSRYVSMNVLARDKMLYDGHAVAAVAAVNPQLPKRQSNLSKLTMKHFLV
jgi:hypothetical protein